jgi:hypothetical protein
MLRAAVILVTVMAGAPDAACETAEGAAEQVALARVPPAFANSALVPAWSNRAAEAAATVPQALPFSSLRASAIMHLAMHDALNAVVPVYRPHAFSGQDRAAHPLAAAAQAAHDVLRDLYPQAAAGLRTELEQSLAGIPDGAARTRGLALGKRVAAAILAARQDDGWNQQGTYRFSEGPGAYQSTPEQKGFVLQPGFRAARPFALTRPARFRSPPPPPLTSPAYAAAYNEVKEQGRSNSSARSADQTAYAVWWMEFSETSFTRVARALAAEHRLHPWKAARLFALLSLSLYDGYLAVWDAKFAHDHWRPHTAIWQAGDDRNPATEPDPAWAPLRPAPPFPEAPSAHATGCSISAEVLAQTFGAELPFTMSTTSAPSGMPTRRFPSFAAAADECADSRVRLGWHFRYSTDAGRRLGRQVASHLLAHHLPLRH